MLNFYEDKNYIQLGHLASQAMSITGIMNVRVGINFKDLIYPLSNMDTFWAISVK